MLRRAVEKPRSRAGLTPDTNKSRSVLGDGGQDGCVDS